MSNTFECDCCTKETPDSEKHYCLTNRPSCPQEIVAVMWTCPDCAKQVGASGPDEIKKIDDQFEEKGYADFGGVKCLWLSI